MVFKNEIKTEKIVKYTKKDAGLMAVERLSKAIALCAKVKKERNPEVKRVLAKKAENQSLSNSIAKDLCVKCGGSMVFTGNLGSKDGKTKKIGTIYCIDASCGNSYQIRSM